MSINPTTLIVSPVVSTTPTLPEWALFLLDIDWSEPADDTIPPSKFWDSASFGGNDTIPSSKIPPSNLRDSASFGDNN